MILSTHVLQEVQAVCDRIIIMNKGKVVADELTENINRAVEGNRRYRVKVCGPQREVLNVLRARPDVAYAEVLDARDGDACTYMIESAAGVDIRKKLFFTLAEKGWALIGLEALGLSLEDIFITVVNKTDEDAPTRYTRRAGRKVRTGLESQVAASLVAEADRKREESVDKADED